MNDKWVEFAIRIQSIAQQGFDMEKISTTKNGMKNCGRLRQKCCR